MPNTLDMPPIPDDHKTNTLQAFSDYDLPSVEALIRYFHTASGFPVRDTWLKSIKAGKFASWPGLTYQNAAKACPSPTISSRDTWFRCAKESYLPNQIQIELNANNLRLLAYLEIQPFNKIYISRLNTSSKCTLMILDSSLSALEV